VIIVSISWALNSNYLFDLLLAAVLVCLSNIFTAAKKIKVYWLPGDGFIIVMKQTDTLRI